MDILSMLVLGALNIGCFFVGAKVGQKVVKGEEIKTPSINPMQYYREFQEKRAVEEEKNRLDAILRNIDRYDGTNNGQEDVPR